MTAPATSTPPGGAQTAPVQPARPGAGLSLGRPFGIPVRISASWLLFGALVTALVQPVAVRNVDGLSEAAGYGVGAIVAVLLLVSVLVHEFAHGLAARALGLRVQGITIIAIGGYTETDARRTPGEEGVVAVVGPLASLSCGALAWAAYLVSPAGSAAEVVLFATAATNVLLGGLNLLPGLPLDGGRVVSAAIWAGTGSQLRGMRAGGYGGLAVAVSALAVGVTALSRNQPWAGAQALVIGGFVGAGAYAVLSQVRVQAAVAGLDAAALARPAHSTPGEAPTARVLSEAERAGRGAVVLDDGYGAFALLSSARVAALPAQQLERTPVSAVSRPLEPDLVLPGALRGEALLARLHATPASEYLVVDAANRVLGVLVTADVDARLRRR